MGKYVGQSVNRIDARAKVIGQAKYPGDIDLPDQAWMKILFSQRTHAIVRKIDAAAAAAVPGVLAVFTAKDVPNNEYGLGTPDQPVLCGPGSNKPFGDHVRCLGDQVALVIAETEEIAAQARDLISVEYEDLKPVFNPLEAMGSNDILVHPDRDSNVFCHYRIRKGDMEQGFADADVIVEADYETPAQEHAYLQPEAGVSYIDEEGRITIKVAGQWVHEDQEQVAHALKLPLDQIRVIYPAIGGAFGGREDMSVQIVLALAAWRLHQQGIDRPVKIIWSREESIIGHHKRHPFYMHAKWGAKKDGTLTAAQVRLVADGGGYIYTSPKVLGNATLLCTGPYRIPNVSVDAYAVYTNNLPTGAFRGFGGPQGLFEAESQISKIAERLGMDPVEIRMKNILREGDLLSVQTPLPKGVAIGEVLERCALEAGWKDKGSSWKSPNIEGKPVAANGSKTAWGIACGYKNIGFSFGAPEKCTAIVELYGDAEIERVVLHHAAAEVGQGTHTVLTQAAAEVLDIPIEKIELIASDTASTLNSGSVSASRMTFMGCNAVKGAAEAALKKWKSEERPAIATFEYHPPATTPFDPETGKSEPNFAYGYVAIAVKAEVNPETGQITLKKVICVDDVGQAINPLQVKGQIEGAIVQAAGYALQENFIQDAAGVKTRTLSTYLIPTILDIPEEIKSIIIEVPDQNGPWGAKGMGEMPYLCLVPSITSAIHNATGVWFDEFPLVPEKVLKGLGKI